ncbi:transporter substrate-binding domain-containing protein [Marinobacter sp. C2H3]|uniref:transporter substrate-binding domain-containing protein n=1 Tax=Marinobacter sp. C2H3 TaxID=3119003 RepID=UPI00300F6CE0
MTRFALLTALWLLTLIANTRPAFADTEITIGVYNFPPIAGMDGDRVTGLLGDLLETLEAVHPGVHFKPVYTSPRRRYLDYQEGLFDVMFFESGDWEWRKRGALVSRPILMDEEFYVALKKPGRDLSFFDDIADRHILAMAGYHYGFAGLEADDRELRKRFHIEFSDSQQRNLKLIKADRPSVAEVAIMSQSFLRGHLAKSPKDWDKLLISDRPDQTYKLGIVTRPNGPVTADDMINLLEPLIDNGQYRLLVEKWNLRLPPGFFASFADDRAGAE